MDFDGDTNKFIQRRKGHYLTKKTKGQCADGMHREFRLKEAATWCLWPQSEAIKLMGRWLIVLWHLQKTQSVKEPLYDQNIRQRRRFIEMTRIDNRELIISAHFHCAITCLQLTKHAKRQSAFSKRHNFSASALLISLIDKLTISSRKFQKVPSICSGRRQPS